MNGPLYLILVIEVFLTAVVLGVLWFVQLIHYPLFKRIKEDFPLYEKEHIRRISYFFIPLIVADVFFNVLLAVEMALDSYALLICFALALNVMTWLATFIFQIDQHKKLSVSFSKKTINSLIRTGWAGTLFWSAKAGCLFTLLLKIHH